MPCLVLSQQSEVKGAPNQTEGRMFPNIFDDEFVLPVEYLPQE